MKIVFLFLISVALSHSAFAQDPATPAPNLPSGTSMPTQEESPNSPSDKALVDQSHQGKAGDLKKHADKKKKMKKMKNKKNGAAQKLRKNKKNHA